MLEQTEGRREKGYGKKKEATWALDDQFTQSRRASTATTPRIGHGANLAKSD